MTLTDRWSHKRVDLDWQDRSDCRNHDPELWFPESSKKRRYDRQTRERIVRAKVICRECPVIQECLAYALTAEIRFGIYGGMTADERDRILGLPRI